ncbi:MAG: SDR family NAD(P)-dependent oxidoreductase [Burkholderiales bacterium]|nr:SDR family NAD(P)-dependent oxidoreductase [Burkholderiales bacterium]
MDLGIRGRKALVFGGSRGMGRATAEVLAREGVQVTIAARNAAVLKQAAEELSAAAGIAVAHVVADLTRPAGREAALAACPDPDILINNADGPAPGDFRDWTRETWIETLDATMLGPIMMIRAVIDGMIARRFGRIVNISSRSVKSPQAELGLSNGARSGLVGFVAGLSRQTVRHNVTINNLLPGIFASDAQVNHVKGLVEMTGRPYEELWQERARSNPALRYGEVQEFGAYCAFICSAHAGYITGQNLLIDGGAYPGTF